MDRDPSVWDSECDQVFPLVTVIIHMTCCFLSLSMVWAEDGLQVLALVLQVPYYRQGLLKTTGVLLAFWLVSQGKSTHQYGIRGLK